MEEKELELIERRKRLEKKKDGISTFPADNENAKAEDQEHIEGDEAKVFKNIANLNKEMTEKIDELVNDEENWEDNEEI